MRICLLIEYKRGDIFKENVEALVNPVNCVGIMGAGLALQFKKVYSENFRLYAAACQQGKVQPGQMFITRFGISSNPKWIINFPTKRHWRNKSRIEDIVSGLVTLREEVLSKDIQSIAIPPLGCGLGGLKWADVWPHIASSMMCIGNVRVVIFESR